MGHANNKKHGYISLHRSIKSHWLFPKGKFTQFEAWTMMLMTVNHKDIKVQIGNKILLCKRSESLNSLDTWSRLFGWHKSKTRRFFDLLEKDKMIVRKSTQKTTHLTICNYDTYQNSRHLNDTLATPNNNDKEIEIIVSYLVEKSKKKFKTTAKLTRSCINARLSEGYTIDDFKHVIDVKVSQWVNDKKMSGFVRPQTLFGNNFEGYLNETSQKIDPSELKGHAKIEHLENKPRRTEAEEIELHKLKSSTNDL